MQAVTIYTTALCGYCHAAKRLLHAKGVEYTEIKVDAQPDLRAEMVEKSGRRTVPQIFIGDQAVGGYDDISILDRIGKLDTLLRGDE